MLHQVQCYARCALMRNCWLSAVIIHQIFSLACDWPKCITWPNIPQLKLEYSPIFKPTRVAKKIWRIINTIASMLGYLSLDIICSSKLAVLLELQALKTVRFSEQMMSADKYLCIFSCQIAAIVYIPVFLFFNNKLFLSHLYFVTE